jgi:hypothetical protein
VAIRSTSLALALVACVATQAWGQSAPQAAPAPAPASDTWSFSASAYTYLLPDEGNYVQPTFTAEHSGGLHLEARYNYEDRETASVWAGYTFGGGDAVEWQIKPLLGGVFGNTSGIAPGYKGSVSWKILEGYSEGEYVFDLGESTDSFFYSWSELGLAPAEWLRGGLVTQRTRVYKSEREVQRGLFVGTAWRKLDVTVYVFNPDDSKPTVILAAGWSW